MSGWTLQKRPSLVQNYPWWRLLLHRLLRRMDMLPLIAGARVATAAAIACISVGCVIL
ncbi:MAG: hypothetical protein V4567_11710 [Pseudomonadota bacterium]